MPMRLRSSLAVGENGTWKEAAAMPSEDGSEQKPKQKKSQRTQVWETTRVQGFLSFLVPLSVIAALGATGDSVEVLKAASEQWPHAAKLTAIYFALWASKEVLLNCFKYWLMVHKFGISKEHFALIIGPRADWKGDEIPTLVKTYTHYRIKVMDAISRRAGHLLINVFRITFYAMVPTNSLRLQTAILQLPVISTLKLLTESGDNFGDIGRFVFQGSRVMDGQYGRFNLVVVNFWAYAGRIIMFQLLVSSRHNEEVAFCLFMLSMMPMLWGDTFGEVIGSFFGKHSFAVRGLGEVNRKTVEGTFAVFLSSFVSMYVAFYYVVDFSSKDNTFVYSPVVVFLYTSFIACLFEAFAPRSTDNFFLMVITLLILLCSAA